MPSLERSETRCALDIVGDAANLTYRAINDSEKDSTVLKKESNLLGVKTQFLTAIQISN